MVGVFTPWKLATATNLFLLLLASRRDCFHTVISILQPWMWSQTKGWLYDSPLYTRMTKSKPSSLKKDISLQETAPTLESLSLPVGGRQFSALSFLGSSCLAHLDRGGLCDHTIQVNSFPRDIQLPWEISTPSPL